MLDDLLLVGTASSYITCKVKHLIEVSRAPTKQQKHGRRLDLQECLSDEIRIKTCYVMTRSDKLFNRACGIAELKYTSNLWLRHCLPERM
jgi:hypothetical protein